MAGLGTAGSGMVFSHLLRVLHGLDPFYFWQGARHGPRGARQGFSHFFVARTRRGLFSRARLGQAWHGSARRVWAWFGRDSFTSSTVLGGVGAWLGRAEQARTNPSNSFNKVRHSTAGLGRAQLGTAGSFSLLFFRARQGVAGRGKARLGSVFFTECSWQGLARLGESRPGISARLGAAGQGTAGFLPLVSSGPAPAWRGMAEQGRVSFDCFAARMVRVVTKAGRGLASRGMARLGLRKGGRNE